METPHHKTLTLVCVVVTVGIVAGIMNGCGKKTLPIPPVTFNPPAVENLDYAVSGDQVRLAWSYSIYERPWNESPLSGFFVYVAVEPLSDTLCRDCPLNFRRIGEVPYHGEPDFWFDHTLSHGYWYTYKVLPYSDDGVKGSLPMTVQFDFQ